MISLNEKRVVLGMKPGDQKLTAVEIPDKRISLTVAQSMVEGYVEKMTVAKSKNGREIDLLMNEEGKNQGLATTVGLLAEGRLFDIVAGPIAFVAATRGGNWETLTEDEVEIVTSLFAKARLISEYRMIPVLEIQV